MSAIAFGAAVFAMKHLLRRIWFCWARDRHWTETYRGFAPMRSGNCSGCGMLIYDVPHERESLDLPRRTT